MSQTIGKNNGEMDWILRDTARQVFVPAGQSVDLELTLNRYNIAASDQLIADIQNADLSLAINDGTKDLDSVQALRHILFQQPSGDIDSNGAQRVSFVKPDFAGPDFITPDWSAPRTWYYKSQKFEDIALVPMATNPRVYVPADYATHGGPWVQNNMSLYSDEDTKTTEAGDVPRLVVKLDGQQIPEMDYQWLISPEIADVGDFRVDYSLGHVIFHKQPVGNVTATIWKVGSSCWVMKPSPGKKLLVDSAEAQFSRDVSLRDTITFETLGYVQAFAPHLWVENGGPLPTNHLITLRKKIYKSMSDFIDEANGALPVIPASSAQQKTFRDLTVDVVTYPWNYRSVLALHSSLGMEVRVYLENDVPYTGKATATFYTFSLGE